MKRAARILALDTAGERLYAALGEGALILRSRSLGPHDERIFPQVERLLRRAGWDASSIDALAVSSGPGRFTGIRIGMTFAALWGKILKRPVLAISRLEAIAYRLREDSRLDSGAWAVLNAGSSNGEFFLQAFARRRGFIVALDEPAWVKAEDLRRALGRLPRFPIFGPGTEEARRLAGPVEVIPGVNEAVTAADFLAPAFKRFSSGKTFPFRPLYLKPANFQRPVS